MRALAVFWSVKYKDIFVSFLVKYKQIDFGKNNI